MKRVLGVLAFAVLLHAAVVTVFYTRSFIATGSSPAVRESGSGTTFNAISWSVTGTLNTCTVKLEQSATGTGGWTDLITNQTCTAGGTSTAVAGSPNYVRITTTIGTGGGTLKVTINGYNGDPSGGGGSVVWGNVTQTPTSIEGYGITNACGTAGGAACTMAGQFKVAASTTGGAGVFEPGGVSPTTCVDGERWYRAADGHLWLCPGGVATQVPLSSDLVALYPVYYYAADAGASDSYAACPTPAITSYSAGNYLIKVNTSNTGASDLTLCSIAGGAKTIKKYQLGSKVDTETGDLIAGQTYLFTYDGTDMVLTSRTSISVADMPTMTATVAGKVPTPPNNTTTFLRGDGTFAAPSGGGTGLWMFTTTTTQTVAGSGNTFGPVVGNGGTPFSGTESLRQIPAAAAGHLTGISVNTMNSQPSGGTLVFVVRTCTPTTGACTGSDTTVTCSVAASGAAGGCSADGFNAAFAKNDLISVHITNNSGSTSAQIQGYSISYTIP